MASHQPTTRLDRLSALLQAAAPSVLLPSTQGQTGPLSNTLHVSLLATPGHLPHSVHVQHSHQGRSQIECGNDWGATSTCPLTMQVQLNGPAAPVLMREFAQPMVLLLAGADPALKQAVQLLCSELAAPRCGQPAMLASAGNMLFIGLLRHLVAHPQASSGLFVGLSDPRIAAALVAMHEQPQSAWTLASLADKAGMSRTAFATRFKETMRTPPGKYLSQLRMFIAQRAVESGKGLKGAARESGYKDVSALSRALGRVRTLSTSNAKVYGTGY